MTFWGRGGRARVCVNQCTVRFRSQITLYMEESLCETRRDRSVICACSVSECSLRVWYRRTRRPTSQKIDSIFLSDVQSTLCWSCGVRTQWHAMPHHHTSPTLCLLCLCVSCHNDIIRCYCFVFILFVLKEMTCCTEPGRNVLYLMLFSV